MFADVWQQVVRGRYASFAATLPGYARYAVRNETYPGVVAAGASQVPGLVYVGIDNDDIARLDQFEGASYQRCEVVVVAADGALHTVHTYLFNDAANLTDRPWRPEAFAMAQFLATYCRDKLGS